MQSLKPGRSSTSGTYRPRWRNDASGAGGTITYSELHIFQKKCLELALSWPSHTQDTLSDLVDCLSNIDQESQSKVTNSIQIWLASSPSENDIIKLREHVRMKTMTRRARKRQSNKTGYADGKKIYDLLEPQNTILKHQWLFAKRWVEYSPEDLEEDTLDFNAREKEFEKKRIAALKEIIKAYGSDGVITLCQKGDGGFNIGFLLGRYILSANKLKEFALTCLSMPYNKHSYRIDNCLSGLIHQMEESEKKLFIIGLIEKISSENSETDKLIRLFVNAPFSSSIWNILNTQNDTLQ